MITNLRNLSLTRIYQPVWSPIVREEDLEWRNKKENEEGEFAIDVFRHGLQRETLVEQILRNVSKFEYKFLQLPNSNL